MRVHSRQQLIGEAHPPPAVPTTGAPKERQLPIAKRDFIARYVLRPELSSLLGLGAVFTYFAITAGSHGFLSAAGTKNYLEVGAEIGLITIPVCLLMIAGEFDLSVGAMVGAGGIVVSGLIVRGGWPIWAALLVGFGASCAVGLVNGILVLKTGLPSLIVTLGVMYSIQGATLSLTQQITGNTEIDGVAEAARHDPLRMLFNSHPFGVDVSIVWFVAATVIATWVLTRTPFGNWIYATGGDGVAARRAGVPTGRVKTLLFVATAFAATIIGVIASFSVNSASTTNGTDLQFQSIVAAVIGGTLLSGGAGSPVGAALGALIFGMVSQGFFFTNINSNWFQTFIGVMLLIAALTNTYIRARTHRRSAV
jgi:simple sugar transport system permease protein